jgi:beta-lactamase superfamily II metal-dependent hydrolase
LSERESGLPLDCFEFAIRGWPQTATENECRARFDPVPVTFAIFVEGPGFTLLYDGGSQGDPADGADNRIVAYIAKVRPGLKTIDHLILSHPHKDHLQLLPEIFDRFVVHNVWNSGAINKAQGYCRFLRKVMAEPLDATSRRETLPLSQESQK